MSNTYAKYCPNVFLAKCDQLYKRGDIIPVTTKHGKENDSIVFNLIFERDGFFYYSIVRADGFNVQEWAKKRAEKLENAATNAAKRSSNWYEKSNEGKDFLALGEPIKIGHHSEKRHRALIERNHARMDNCVKESSKAEDYQRRAEYWNNRTEIINLSMPESIEYFEFKLEEAKKYHAGLKDGSIEREHSMSLQYANKAVKDTQKNYDLAIKLWGDSAEDIPPNSPQVETVENKTLETEIISDTYEIHANENHSQLDFSNISIEPTPPTPVLKIIPRDWQVEIMNEVIAAPEQSLIVNAPTGAGKMVFIMLLVQYYLQFNKPMLILVDRIALITQLSDCATKYGIRHNIIQSKNSINIGSLVTIASVQSYDYTLPPPEYLFIDECHSLYNKVAELIPKAAKAIGFTATAITKGLGLVYQRVINATTAQILTRNGIITPFSVLYMSKIDMVNAKLIAGEYSAIEVQKRSAKIYGDVVEMYQRHTPLGRGIVFCATKTHCEEVAALFTAQGIAVGVYTSSTKEADRVELLRKFDDDEIKLLISVSALSKGFDKGYIEVILDLRPLRRSLAEYIQVIGRGLRQYPNKTNCIVLDFSGNWERFAGDYENISRHGVPEDLNNDVMRFNRARSDDESDMSLCPQCSSNMCHTCAMCGFELYPRAKITTDTENIEAIELPALDLSSDGVVRPLPPPRVPKFSILTRVKQFLGVQS